jgi:plastocyanin
MKYMVLACAALVALAVPGAGVTAHQASTANTYTVFLGDQSEISGGFKKYPVLINQFLPSRIVIAAGDSVSFSSATFHTATFPNKPLPLFVPDPAKGTYTGITDAAGQQYYFEGKPKLAYNPQAFAPFGPKTISGKTPASTGGFGPQGPKDPAAKVTYTFPKPGSYTLFCTLHPGMKGTVVVKPAGSAVPKTPAQVQAEALALQTRAWDVGKKLHTSTKVAPNTVAMGVGGKVTTLAFYPKVLKIKAGTTVTFVNKASSEVHDAAFGPTKYVEKIQRQTDLFPMGPNSKNQVAPFLLFGTDPGTQTHAGASTHGNGFLVTRLAAGAPIGLPRSTKVRFTAPGTYKYFCWIHGTDMSGTVVVTP